MENLYYGRGRDEDNAKLIAFLDEVFFTDDPEKRDFKSLLPKIYRDEDRPAYNNFVVQQEDGEFRAAIGDFYCPMTIGGEDILSCCIGNVAVGKKFRSMGYMIELMNMSIEDMKKNGVDLAYLGGQRQRYGYFGFEKSGVRYTFNFNKSTVKHAVGKLEKKLEVKKICADDRDALNFVEKLYSRHPVRAKRNSERYYDVLCSWRSTPYLVSDGDKPVGYFVLNRSEDGVLEFAVASPDYYPALVCAVFETVGHSIDFDVPPFYTEAVKYFTEKSEGMDIIGCEQILVFNFRKVIGALMRVKAGCEGLADGEMTVLIHGKNGDEKLKLSVKDNCPSVEDFDGEAEYEFDHFEATRAMFSIMPADRSRIKPEARSWLPLPSFMFSLDNM